MTFTEAFHSARTWQRKVVLVSLFHNARLMKNKHWTLTNSAKYFNVSIGLISENLKLSELFEEVKHCKSRNEALKRLKK